MKIISSAVLVALFAVSQGRFLDGNGTPLTSAQTYAGITYASTLKCGACVGVGGIYCVKKQEANVANGYQATSDETCLASTSTAASQQTAVDWQCTSAFADRVYSKYVCGFNTAVCGTTNIYSLATVNSTASFNVSGLQLGQTCFYKVSAACGGPSFQPNDTNAKYEYEYVEFRDSDVVNSSDSVRGYNNLTSVDPLKRSGTPATGMPRRNQFFRADSGANMVASGNFSTYNASTNGTLGGRQGRYDKVQGGRKAYGNTNQAAGQLSMLTNTSNPTCATRSLYLAVTALADSQYVKIDLTSVDFYRPAVTESGASFLSMTVAALVGLISLAFF